MKAMIILLKISEMRRVVLEFLKLLGLYGSVES